MVRPSLPLWAVPGLCAGERISSEGLESAGVGTEIPPAGPSLGPTFTGEGVFPPALASGPPPSLQKASSVSVPYSLGFHLVVPQLAIP